jgi:hypothetical protein
MSEINKLATQLCLKDKGGKKLNKFQSLTTLAQCGGQAYRSCGQGGKKT